MSTGNLSADQEKQRSLKEPKTTHLSIAEKLGCATLIVTCLAAVANWLVVPGVLPDRSLDRSNVSNRKTAQRPSYAPMDTTNTTPPAKRDVSSSTSINSASPDQADHVKATTETRSSVQSNPIKLLPVVLGSFVWSPKKNPSLHTVKGFEFEFDICRYYKGDDSLHCLFSVKNVRPESRVGRVNSVDDSASVVDASGKAFGAAHCWLGGDDGAFYARQKLASGVSYHLEFEFKNVGLTDWTLRYLEFTFFDESVSPPSVMTVSFKDPLVLKYPGSAPGKRDAVFLPPP